MAEEEEAIVEGTIIKVITSSTDSVDHLRSEEEEEEGTLIRDIILPVGWIGT